MALERDRERQDLRHDDVEGDGHGAARRREQDRPDDRARAPREERVHGRRPRDGAQDGDDTLLAAFCARRWHTGSYQ